MDDKNANFCHFSLHFKKNQYLCTRNNPTKSHDTRNQVPELSLV